MRKEPRTQSKYDSWEGHAHQQLLFPSLPNITPPPFKPFANSCYSVLSFILTSKVSHLAGFVSSFFLPPHLELFDPLVQAWLPLPVPVTLGVRNSRSSLLNALSIS